MKFGDQVLAELAAIRSTQRLHTIMLGVLVGVGLGSVVSPFVRATLAPTSSTPSAWEWKAQGDPGSVLVYKGGSGIQSDGTSWMSTLTWPAGRQAR